MARPDADIHAMIEEGLTDDEIVDVFMFRSELHALRCLRCGRGGRGGETWFGSVCPDCQTPAERAELEAAEAAERD